MSSPETTSESFEERKFTLEEKKLELEMQKIKIERFKGWATGGSIVISLLIAAVTIAFGIWSQHKQVMMQIALQDKQAKSQFEIQAAEIVMNTDTPGVTHNKAKALLALFPDTLPKNFAESFDPSKYVGEYPEIFGNVPQARGAVRGLFFLAPASNDRPRKGR